MKTDEFSKLKEKIRKLKESKARAEGAVLSLRKELKNTFELDGKDEAIKAMKKKKVEIAKYETQLHTMNDELQNLIDWDDV